MIWFIYSSPNPKHIHASMHNKKKTSNVAYTFFREFVCAWDGTLYTRQRSFWNLYLCQGLLFESPRWWKESTKAWPVTRVTGHIAWRVLESQVWGRYETRLWLIKLQRTSVLTWAQYWDLAAATRSFNTGWDWETRGVTAWMTAVNLEGGFKPEREWREEPKEVPKSNTEEKLHTPVTHPGANVRPLHYICLPFLTYWQNRNKVRAAM